MAFYNSIASRYKHDLTDTSDNTREAELKELRDRSIWMVANNGYAASAYIKNVGHWVGSGIVGRWRDKKLQKLWVDFTKSPMLDGVGSFANYQVMLASEVFTSGEMFTRTHFENDSTEIPFSIEAIQARYCPIDKEEGLLDVGKDEKGIYYNARTNRPVKYKFYNYIKGKETDRFESIKRKLVTVKADRIIHTFEKRSAQQKRGHPFLTPAILPLWEIQDLTDATITRQQAAQAVGWIVTKVKELAAFPQLGTTVSAPQIPDTWARHWGAKPPSENPKPRLEVITPGGVHYLNEGETIHFAEIDDVGRNLQVLLRHLLRKCAGALGMMYEQLTGDLTEVNYSSIRAGLIDFLIRTEQIQQLLIIEGGLAPIAQKFREFAEVWTGETFNPEIDWILPRKYGVDQLKDIKGDIEEVSGDRPLSLWSDKIEARGRNFDDYLAQLKKEDDYVRARNEKINPTPIDKPDKTGGSASGDTAKTDGGKTGGSEGDDGQSSNNP